MDVIKELFEIDIVAMIIGIFIIMSAVISMITIIGKFSEYIGKPIKWIQNKNSDHILLICTAERVERMEQQREIDVEQSIRHDKEIKNDLEKLTKLFIDKEIDDLRGQILSFASRLSSGSKYNQENFSHILRAYQKYENILHENNMKNGLVSESIEYIKDEYQKSLRNGEF